VKIYFITKPQIIIGIISGIILVFLGFFIVNRLDYGPIEPTTDFSPIYQGSGEKQQISLAVNVDWGEEFIPDMIKIFNQNKIKCSFFLTGRWTEKFPNIAKVISQNNHEIGNHGYKHDSTNNMSLEQVKSDIIKTEKIIKSATGIKTKLYAPPSGERGEHVLKAARDLGYQVILWSIDTIDWQCPAPQTIMSRVLDKAHNGAIVLMHPTEPTLKALPGIIRELKKRGFQFVTVSENIKG
jgi:probable sporulation protein (polysaccharide deacetylase family)